MNEQAGTDREGGPARLPHAVLDLASRRCKGMKIERLLGLERRIDVFRMLEVGTGSGGIAHYFGTHPSLRCQVDAVDVRDNRLVRDGYRYHPVADTRLPFEDDWFDVVLSNHVIEHVGDKQEQGAHLAELRRVMRSDGVGYLAVPNRWMLIEPHYRLAFLSWLPRSWRTPYLRARGKGVAYDCEPLPMKELESLFAAAGLECENLGVKAMRATLEIEHPQSLAASMLRRIPNGVLSPFCAMIPTHIYRFSRATVPNK